MPALSSTLPLDTLIGRNLTLDSVASSLTSNATNTASPENVMQVVCAWPVSGQYGPGSRVLYYALVAACVFARKAEWLRNACLAAALVFPAVAALHGIVLTAVHVDGAVDMDVYGAFQFCSIGILAAPLTVRISRTYFYDPGRNIIFLWTGLILAGLLSLTVEFFRITTSPCPYDDNGVPIGPNDYHGFLFNREASCNLTCSVDAGPSSPLRQDATNEIFVIPAPHVLAFNAATLLAAACCIPAVLSLVSMWNKILEINWKITFGQGDGDQLIEGTNGATVARMTGVNAMIRLFLSTIEVPLFSAAVLAILIYGEKNFFSDEVKWQTEPMTSIGQWAPVVGTGLAALGSLYVLLAVDFMAEEEANSKATAHHCNCSHHHFGSERHVSPHAPSGEGSPRGSIRAGIASGDTHGSPEQDPRRSQPMADVSGGLFAGSSQSVTVPSAAHIRSSSSNSRRGASSDIAPSTHRPPMTDIGGRRKVARVLWTIGNYFGTAARDRFDDSEFKHGKAIDFPEIPAEEQRNPDLPQIREVYNQHRDDEDLSSALSLRHTRSGSFNGSIASRYSTEGSPIVSRAISAPHPPSPTSRSPSPSPTVLGVRHASTLPVERRPSDFPNSASLSATESTRGRTRQRSDTLEVPGPIHHSSSRNNQPASPTTPTTPTTITNGQGSPAILISPVADTNDTNPVVEEPTSLSPPITHSSLEVPSQTRPTPPP
ncbi:hypothetical protein F5Y13DRAFT_152456 [Hypoxylon sp. FL1857]|nr:hypothetical protein F5Y13DRAFT_152456 [Hypoxylon sp. FL1857]